MDIVAFGPRTIDAARPFNPQPDGSSAIWLRASRALRPDARICLGAEELETVICGTLATAKVPKASTVNPGEIPLVLSDPNGQLLSNVVTLQISEAPGDPEILAEA